MIRSRDEIFNMIKEYIPSDSENATAFLEDLADTFDSLSAGITQQQLDDAINAKDREWRERYHARFYSNSVDEPESQDNTAVYETDDEKINKKETLADIF